MLPSLKLTYFPIKARAEPIRLALAINNIPFIDERLDKTAFALLKASETLPFRQVPVLVVDGEKVISQSTAILRYVGKLGSLKLYPEDPFHAALVDQIISQVQDVEASMKPSMVENDPEKKLAMRKALAETEFPKLWGDLDKFIASHGGKYATGDQITIADLFLYQANTSFGSGAYDGIPTDCLQSYANIQKVVAAVKAHAAVAAWEAAH
ncbi:hypothetical protein HDU91_000027 [Kappamyces sp. JEL0680]|nr:hypothetical protein HDU91_000027 [Kappamyces sp. JEL0680]